MIFLLNFCLALFVCHAKNNSFQNHIILSSTYYLSKTMHISKKTIEARWKCASIKNVIHQLNPLISFILIDHLQLQFRAAPMTAFGIVTNSISCSHTNPLWNWPILLLKFGQLLLDSKRLVSAHFLLN